MLFYRVKTPTGDRLVRKQSEAKAIDPAFTPFELPSDKDGQMDLLNGLLDQINQLQRGIVPETVEPKVEAIEVPARVKPVSQIENLSLRDLDTVDEIMVRTGVENVLWGLDRAAVERLEPIFRERLAEVS